MNLSSSSPFSPHNDVLTATPTTTAEKLSLIEELKRRGRISVTSKNYPDAKHLYTKAIDILSSENDAEKKDLAILYSNRALCNLQMNQISDSYDDALSATSNDESYVKGYWRLGQASMALKKTEEAIVAYENALKLESGNKALKKEYEKAKKQFELEMQQAEEQAARKAKDEAEGNNKNDVDKEAASKVSKQASSAVSSSSSLPSSSSSSSSTKEGKKEIFKSGEFSKSDHVRGYKIINGKKTSFFHHEQTEEEKRLIGDITPKRIDPAQLQQQQQQQQQQSSSSTGPTKLDNSTTSGTSAWNKAGTWEEKDVTDWAIQTLEQSIQNCEYDLPQGSPDPNAQVIVTKVTKLLSAKVAGGTCHASVATVRGKKRYIFEFTICVHWEMTLGDGRKCKGQMAFLDVDGTHQIGDGYDMVDYSVESDSPSDARYLLERFVRDGGLRVVVEKALDGWINLFHETY